MISSFRQRRWSLTSVPARFINDSIEKGFNHFFPSWSFLSTRCKWKLNKISLRWSWKQIGSKKTHPSILSGLFWTIQESKIVPKLCPTKVALVFEPQVSSSILQIESIWSLISGISPHIRRDTWGRSSKMIGLFWFCTSFFISSMKPWQKARPPTPCTNTMGFVLLLALPFGTKYQYAISFSGSFAET